MSDNHTRSLAMVPGGAAPRRPAGREPVTKRRGAIKKRVSGILAALATAAAASAGAVASAAPAHNAKLLTAEEASKSPGPPETAAGTFTIPSALARRVEDVPLDDLVTQAMAAHKAGGAGLNVRLAEKLPASNPLLLGKGKPEIVFLGAEYCPYCATERWSLVMALSKFGNFSHLAGTTSSSTDVSPSTPSFSFYGASYSSARLVFLGDEMFNNHGPSAAGYPALQAPDALETMLLSKYDTPPYVPAGDSGGIPFIYLAGRFVLIGPQWLTSQLSRVSWAEAASTLTSGTSALSKQAEAAAGFLVGDICAITRAEPASVCTHVPSALLGASTSVTG